MPYLGWASLGGNELINNARVSAYSKGISILCSCDTLSEALGDDLYRSPAEDKAPWWEATIPESEEFWGVLGLEIHGASQSTLSRAWTDLIEDGAVAGAGRRGAREIEFKVMLVGGTEAGLSYGLSWLSAALLAGLALNAVAGWWWADPLAALAIAGLAAHEGLEAIRGDDEEPAET